MMSRRIIQACLFCGLGLSLAACAVDRPISYSLADSEIFVAPRPHFINLAVAVMEDRRSPEEATWASRFDLPSDLPGFVSERIALHLRVSSVFSQVQILSGPVDPNESDHLRELVSKGADAVLVGEMVHYYGRNDPDRRIAGIGSGAEDDGTDRGRGPPRHEPDAGGTHLDGRTPDATAWRPHGPD